MGREISLFQTLLSLLLYEYAFFSGQALAQPSGCSTAWPGWRGIKYLFTFGDSYSQTGFNPSGTQPSPGNPLGNPPYPGWTSCSGPNWVDFLTVTYNASALLTYNLADGGATVDAALAKPWKPEVLSLIDQVNKRWLGIYAKKPVSAKWASEDTLFAFWIGINDVGNTYWDSNRTRVNTIFKEYGQLVEQVYASGARNFVFLNVPPLQRAPLTVQAGGQGVTLEEKAVKSWNADLAKLSDTLLSKHADVTASVFSTYDVFDKAMNNPAAFPQTAMLRDTKQFCNGYANGAQSSSKASNGCKFALGEYFWMNNLHPTYPIHNATAAELARLLAAQPANVGKSCRIMGDPSLSEDKLAERQ